MAPRGSIIPEAVHTQSMTALETLTVGVFNPPGDSVSIACVKGIQWIVEEIEGWKYVEVDVETILSGGLFTQAIDVFIIPGGLPQKISQLLSNAAMRKIGEWRANGGGFIGICAGAIVACCRGREGRGFVPGVGVVESNALDSTDAIGEVELEAHAGAPSSFVAALNHMKEINEKTMIPYYNGPILKVRNKEVKDFPKKSTRARSNNGRIHRFSQEDDDDLIYSGRSKGSSNGNVKVEVWATYSSDIGDDLQSAHEARIRSFQEKNNDQHKRRQHDKTAGVPSQGWVCWVCGAPHKKKDRDCCGMKRREHLMQQNGVERLRGVMIARPAIVGVEEEGSGVGTVSRRSVLIGPHPELGYDGANNLLVEAIRYCKPVLWGARNSVDKHEPI